MKGNVTLFKWNCPTKRLLIPLLHLLPLLTTDSRWWSVLQHSCSLRFNSSSSLSHIAHRMSFRTNFHAPTVGTLPDLSLSLSLLSKYVYELFCGSACSIRNTTFSNSFNLQQTDQPFLYSSESLNFIVCPIHKLTIISLCISHPSSSSLSRSPWLSTSNPVLFRPMDSGHRINGR